jgi:triosephosphate isomerase
MTTPDIRPLIAGNWKMNGTRAALREIVIMRRGARNAELAIFPPATLLHEAAEILEDSEVSLGAQDCHPEPAGPFTGDLSAPMLKDAGCAYVIVGHSERRAGHWESDAMVKAKAEAAQRAGLTPIVCVGETRAQRASGEAVAVVAAQVRGSLPPGPAILAYEPIWAIGAGLTPTREEVAEMHGVLRRLCLEIEGPSAARMRLLYGGSVKPGNARDLLSLPDVDGALVGGASLHALDFLAIAQALD